VSNLLLNIRDGKYYFNNALGDFLNCISIDLLNSWDTLPTCLIFEMFKFLKTYKLGISVKFLSLNT